MPRANAGTEVLAEVTEVGVMTDVAASPGNTTLTAGVAAGATLISVASATNFTAGDLFRIGNRPLIEAGEIESIATLDFTLKSALGDAYASGEVVREIEDTPIGDVTEDGVAIVFDGGETPVRSGTKYGVYTYIPSGDRAISCPFSLLNVELENFALAAGIVESDITGAGSAVDPYVLHLREDLYDAELERIWYWQGLRVDGTIVRVEANSGRVFSPQGQISFAQGRPTNIPVVVRVLHGVKIERYSTP